MLLGQPAQRLSLSQLGRSVRLSLRQLGGCSCVPHCQQLLHHLRRGMSCWPGG